MVKSFEPGGWENFLTPKQHQHFFLVFPSRFSGRETEVWRDEERTLTCGTKDWKRGKKIGRKTKYTASIIEVVEDFDSRREREEEISRGWNEKHGERVDGRGAKMIKKTYGWRERERLNTLQAFFRATFSSLFLLINFRSTANPYMNHDSMPFHCYTFLPTPSLSPFHTFTFRITLFTNPTRDEKGEMQLV